MQHFTSFPPLNVGWRWPAALLFFLCPLMGLHLGVSLSERPDVVNADMLTKAYYSLGFFVMGGLDVGLPRGGHVVGRFLLWIGYFGAPILTASTLIEALIKTLEPHRWRLKRIKNHLVIIGSDDLTISYLKALREHNPKVPVLIIDSAMEPLRRDELRQQFNAKVILGDINHSFFLKRLRLNQASKVLLLGADNFQSYETANKILKLEPKLAQKIIIHCSSIRFMRSMANSHVAQQCINFNSYQLAAAGLVRHKLIQHFQQTQPKDVVVLAGFGLFGQTILEELQQHAKQEIDTLAIIDVDANRRVLVVDEQLHLSNFERREVFEGNISHPEVWQKLSTKVDLTKVEPVIILGTGSAEDNLRTALWLRGKYPKAMIIARSHQPSEFAQEVGKEHNIINVSITQLVKENIPVGWTREQ
ncbi:NAD-binding protein [Thalassomonas haliotis]|nr:NAD-binding protein [Thalassomonas haliotis]